MGFNIPLDNDQYNLIHSTSFGSDWLIWLCTNEVLLHGTIDENLDSDPTWLQFNYTAISGDYADVEPMMAILIGEENDITKATYRGRITESGVTSTVVNINESGGTFPAGTYFWIINTFDITYRAWKPSTLDPLTAEVLVDGTIAYRAMQPKIKGAAAKPLRTTYVGIVDPNTGKMRIAFDVSSSAPVAPASSIATYQFTFKAGTYTVVSGSLNSAIVTVDINDNTEQWGKLVITDNNGNTSTRRFYISTLPPVVGFKPTARIASTIEQGWTMSIPAFAGVDDVLNNTFAVCARTIEVFDGVEDTLYPDNNIMFLGWLQRETASLSADPNAGVLSPTTFEFTGVRARMARLVNQPFVFEQSASPTRWGQITTLTPQKAIKAFLDNFSTVTWLCEVDIDIADTTFYFPDVTTQGGNFMDAIKGMAGQITLLAEFAPDGRIGFFEDYTYQNATERLGVDTIAGWAARDAVKDGITKTQEENSSVGKVNGSGAFLYTSIQQVIAYTVAAPSLAQGESQETRTLPAQILASTDTPENALEELEYRAGSLYNFVNNNLYLDVTHRSTIYGLIPSYSEFYTWTIDETIAGDNGLHRIIYDTTTAWVCESVTYTRAANGRTAVKARYHYVQPPGSKGVNTTPQPQNSVVNPLPDLGLPAFSFEFPETMFPDVGLPILNPAQLQPMPNRIARNDGSVVLAWNENRAALLKNFIALTTPQNVDVTPNDLGSHDIVQGIFDPLNTGLTSGNRYAYLLENNSNSSRVQRTSDIFNPSPSWLTGGDIAELYKVLRGTNVNGGLMIYSPDFEDQELYDFDFSVNDGSWFAGFPTAPATYGSGRWNSTHYFNGVVGEADSLYILRNITSAFITTVRVIGFATYASGGGGRNINNGGLPSGAGAFDITVAINTTLTQLQLDLSSNNTGDSDPASGKNYVTRVVVRGSPSGGANVRYSSDRGATFGSAVSVGDPPGAVGGFDVCRASGVSYAAASGKVRKATTLGGAYSDHTSYGTSAPVCVVIPYYRLGSNTISQTTASDPDYLVALSTPDSGSSTLYKVNGATGAKTDITPVAGIVFDNANCITVLYGTKIAVFGLVGGAYKLYVTENTGSSWTLVGTLTNAYFIRDRRGDTRVQANKGQLYIAHNGKIYYTSTWASGGIFPRNTSFIPLGLDPLG